MCLSSLFITYIFVHLFSIICKFVHVCEKQRLQNVTFFVDVIYMKCAYKYKCVIRSVLCLSRIHVYLYFCVCRELSFYVVVKFFFTLFFFRVKIMSPNVPVCINTVSVTNCKYDAKLRLIHFCAASSCN